MNGSRAVGPIDARQTEPELPYGQELGNQAQVAKKSRRSKLQIQKEAAQFGLCIELEQVQRNMQFERLQEIKDPIDIGKHEKQTNAPKRLIVEIDGDSKEDQSNKEGNQKVQFRPAFLHKYI